MWLPWKLASSRSSACPAKPILCVRSARPESCTVPLRASSDLRAPARRIAFASATWNSYCAAGQVVRLASPSELWAYADFRYWPLPIPPMLVTVHAILEHRSSSTGQWVCRFETPPASGPGAIDRTRIPKEMQKRMSATFSNACLSRHASCVARCAGGAARPRVSDVLDRVRLLSVSQTRRLWFLLRWSH